MKKKSHRTDPNPEDARIFVEWKNGTYMSTDTLDFAKEFKKQVARLGPPDIIEFRDTWIQTIYDEEED